MPNSNADFLAQVLDALDGFVYVYDLTERRNVFISKRWAEEFGYTEQDTQGQGALLQRIVHPDDLPAVAAHHRLLRESTDNVARTLEYRVRRGDGRIAWVSSVDRPLERDAEGRVSRIVGHARDLTAQRQAELARAEGEARFGAIVDNLPDAVFIVDGNANILQVNDAASRQLGYTRAEFARMRIPDIVAPEYRERVAERLSIPSGTATARESAHMRKDGTRIPVETMVVAMELQGEPVYLGVARDISDRQRLESQLRDAQRLEAIGRLAGSVAHDFNNILLAILSGAALLDRRGADSADALRIVSDITEAANRGADITRQLLTFGRRQAIDVRAVELSEAVQGMLGVLRRLLDASITLRTDLRRDCIVMADRAMVDQVVMNLTLNARDAMPAGGTLSIRVAPSEGDPEVIELRVSDTGTGIEAKDLSRVFEPFFTTKSDARGSGIGLATVYGIVVQHDGQITVDSTPGSGTSFCVSLPRATRATRAPHATHAPGTQPASMPEPRDPPRTAGAGGQLGLRALSILLVDDMREVRSVIAELLEDQGHRVRQAGSPDEAMEVWDAHGDSVDVLLSDIALGAETDGPALALELRRRKPDLAVLLMSGHATDHRDPRFGDGFEFLQKPFSLDDLNAVLARHFPDL